jgi:phage terminase large subunit
LKLRASAGGVLMMDTQHEDNPVLFNRDGTKTPEGERYIGKLDKLTGVRLARYRYGLWVSAEGMVYEDSWNPAVNIVNSFYIPKEWPRYLAVDFGFVHPFVCLWCAEDPDGRLYIYRQIYKTRTLVEDHAKTIKQVSRWGENGGDPLPRAIICDHDAEDRATLERHLGLYTIPAHKSVSDGIQAVASRFRVQGDNKPRLMIMRDSLVERDMDLAEGKQPTCVQDEPESYIWDTRQGLKKGEQPVKANDDGLDCIRYLTAYHDLVPTDIKYSNRVY